MPSAAIASEQRNSRIDERRTARPSPMREYGVRPAPSTGSPSGRWRCVLRPADGRGHRRAGPPSGRTGGRETAARISPAGRCCRPAPRRTRHGPARGDRARAGRLPHRWRSPGEGPAGPRARGGYGSVAAGGRSCCRRAGLRAGGAARGAVCRSAVMGVSVGVFGALPASCGAWTVSLPDSAREGACEACGNSFGKNGYYFIWRLIQPSRISGAREP